MPGGKPKGSVWTHYEEIRTGDNVRYNCKYCQTSFGPQNATKKVDHLISCLHVPKELKKQLSSASNKSKACKKRKIDSEGEEDEDEPDISPPLPTPEAEAKTEKALEIGDKTKIGFYMDRMTEAEQKTAAEKFVLAVLVTGCAFSLFQHPLWVDFFSYIRPSFKLPQRKAIGSTYLERIYNSFKNTVDSKVKSLKNVHLQFDGWSNRRMQGILNFLVTFPKALLLKFVDTKTNRHTSEYLASEIKKVLLELGVTRVFCLIGDNASNVQKAFRDLKKEYKHLQILGCLAHSLHLIVGWFVKKIPTATAFFAEANKVVRIIKKSTILSSNLTRIRDEKKLEHCQLQLPGKTRWGSQLFCLQSILKNEQALKSLISDKEVEDHIVKEHLPLRNIINDLNFWKLLKEMISILEPLVVTITKIEGDEYGVHKVYRTLKATTFEVTEALLQSSLSAKEKRFFFYNLKSRVGSVIKPIHLAAAILDPNGSISSEFTSSEYDQAINFIRETAENMQEQEVNPEEVMAQYVLYKTKKDVWASPAYWKMEKISPLDWWNAFFEKKDLTKVAVRILSAPVTSASTERSFKTFSFIHSLIRNCLGTLKAAKTAFVAHNWKLLNRKSKPAKKNQAEDKKSKDDLEILDMEKNEGEETYDDDDDDEMEDDAFALGEDYDEEEFDFNSLDLDFVEQWFKEKDLSGLFEDGEETQEMSINLDSTELVLDNGEIMSNDISRPVPAPQLAPAPKPGPAVPRPGPAAFQPGPAVFQPGPAVPQPGPAVPQPGPTVTQFVSKEDQLKFNYFLSHWDKKSKIQDFMYKGQKYTVTFT